MVRTSVPEVAAAAERRRAVYPAVDGLRALAIVAVVCYHLTGVVPGGFFGVDVFFVISGFVVTESVRSAEDAGFVPFVAAFYARRFVRIMPALLVCLVATSIVYTLLIPRAWLSQEIADTGLAAVVGTSNIVLARTFDAYFAPKAAFNPFTQTWSLGVEEQFYALLPLVFLAHRSVRGRFRPWVVPGIVGALTVASFACGAEASRAQPLAAFYLLPSRYWELGLGMLLSFSARRWQAELASRPRACTILGLASLCALAAGFAADGSGGVPVPLAAPAAAGAAGLILVVTSSPDDPSARFFASPPLRFIGRLSYALYLWHWPVFVFARWTFGLTTFLGASVAMLCATACALASYHLVETPLRNAFRTRRASSYAVVAAGFLAVAFTTLGVAHAFDRKDALAVTVTRDAAAWYPDPQYVVAPSPGCGVAFRFGSVGAAGVEDWKPVGCAPKPKRGVLEVVGDSHASAYAKMLRRYALASGHEVRIIAMPSCAFLGLRTPPLPRCIPMQEAVANDLAQRAGPDDVIFLPSLRTRRLVDQWGGPATDGTSDDPAPSAHEQRAIERDALRVLRRIQARGARVVFEAPLPVFRVPAFRCADWYDAHNPDCAAGLSMSRSELERMRAPALGRMRRLARRARGVAVWDPFPMLCPATVCEAMHGATPLFFDGDHLSGGGDDLLAGSFARAMDAVWRGDGG